MSFWKGDNLFPKQQHRFAVTFGTDDFNADKYHATGMVIPPYFIKSIDRPHFEIGTIQAKYLFAHTFNFPKRLVWKPINLTFNDVQARTNISDFNEEALIRDLMSAKNPQEFLTKVQTLRAETFFPNVNDTIYLRDQKYFARGANVQSDNLQSKRSGIFARSTQLIFYKFLQNMGYFNPNELDDAQEYLLRFRSYHFKRNMTKGFAKPDKAGKESFNLLSNNFSGELSAHANDYQEHYFSIHELDEDGYAIETWRVYNPIITDVKTDKLDYSNSNILTYSVNIAYDWAELVPRDALAQKRDQFNKKLDAARQRWTAEQRAKRAEESARKAEESARRRREEGDAKREEAERKRRTGQSPEDIDTAKRNEGNVLLRDVNRAMADDLAREEMALLEEGNALLEERGKLTREIQALEKREGEILTYLDEQKELPPGERDPKLLETLNELSVNRERQSDLEAQREDVKEEYNKIKAEADKIDQQYEKASARADRYQSKIYDEESEGRRREDQAREREGRQAASEQASEQAAARERERREEQGAAERDAAGRQYDTAVDKIDPDAKKTPEQKEKERLDRQAVENEQATEANRAERRKYVSQGRSDNVLP